MWFLLSVLRPSQRHVERVHDDEPSPREVKTGPRVLSSAIPPCAGAEYRAVSLTANVTRALTIAESKADHVSCDSQEANLLQWK